MKVDTHLLSELLVQIDRIHSIHVIYAMLLFMNPDFLGANKDRRPVSTASAELDVEGLGKYQIGQVATIGRAPESQVVLTLPSVSRHHARIFYEGGHYWIKDLDSANGTSINGKRIKLQMLADQDKICLGDAKAVFRTSAQAGGPAVIGQDPLAGAEIPIPDGTPTSGLDAPYSVSEDMPHGTAHAGSSQCDAAAEKEIRALRKKVESLEAQNEMLLLEIRQLRSTYAGLSAPESPSSDQGEMERLRKLVSRLERALADSNQRLRNMQQGLDGTRK
jgi:pSer/pThr/pTyr-binding forkhead associated (FHA) protein